MKNSKRTRPFVVGQSDASGVRINETAGQVVQRRGAKVMDRVSGDCDYIVGNLPKACEAIDGLSNVSLVRTRKAYAAIGTSAGLAGTVPQPIKQITDRDRHDQQNQYERPIRHPDNQ